MFVTVSKNSPEFKGLREFNKIGLKAILLELNLDLNYDVLPQEELNIIRSLIKAMLRQTPNGEHYADVWDVTDLEIQVSRIKPYNMKWRDFDSYSRYNWIQDEFLIVSI